MMNLDQTKYVLQDMQELIRFLEFKIKWMDSKGMDHSTIGALKNCVKELEASRDELECDLINLENK